MVAWIYGGALLPLAVADIRKHTLSNRTVMLFVVGGFLCGIYRFGIWEAVLGFGIGFGLGFFVWLMRAIGGADAKLYAAIGAAVGYKRIIPVIAVSIMIGGAIGMIKLVSLALRKKGDFRKLTQEVMAFVPCMTIAYWYVIL